MDFSEKNRENIKAELEKIKQHLMNADIDNSDPEKARIVNEQLELIDQKLKIIETRLQNEN